MIVTGAFGALGSSVADMLAERGAKLARVDRAENPGGPGWRLGGIDLADEDLFNALQKGRRRLRSGLWPGQIAGAFEMASLAEGGIDPWDRMYRANLRTVLSASSAALPYFKGAGRIVNVAPPPPPRPALRRAPMPPRNPASPASPKASPRNCEARDHGQRHLPTISTRRQIAPPCRRRIPPNGRRRKASPA